MKVGIDIGGSHIAIAILDENEEIVQKKEKDFSKEEKKLIKKTIIKDISENLKEMLQEGKKSISDIELIGIAYPASLRKGNIGMSVNLGIAGYEIVKELHQIFNVKVRIRNDAKCAAIAEKRYGVLKNYKNAIFLTIGTGIGGGVFINNQLLTSSQNDCFKIGHITISKDGPQCKCGRKGCFEKYASIKALKKHIIEQFHLKEDINGKEIHDFMIKNIENKQMKKIINEYINNLSIGISNLINLFEPEAIGIGGSFSYYKDILLDKLIENIKIKSTTLNDSMPDILIAKNKNDAGIIGAVVE